MTLYNEARANDGLAPSYTPEQIYNTSLGTNPYLYPNLDMYSKDYVKKAYNRTDATLEISGGNERARFYTNVNYFRQGISSNTVRLTRISPTDSACVEISTSISPIGSAPT